MGLSCLVKEFLWPPSNSIVRPAPQYHIIALTLNMQKYLTCEHNAAGYLAANHRSIIIHHGAAVISCCAGTREPRALAAELHRDLLSRSKDTPNEHTDKQIQNQSRFSGINKILKVSRGEAESSPTSDILSCRKLTLSRTLVWNTERSVVVKLDDSKTDSGYEEGAFTNHCLVVRGTAYVLACLRACMPDTEKVPRNARTDTPERSRAAPEHVTNGICDALL
ncbi:hypothetical protein EVAR_5120_1 [Eumeta japonica]|uniref:Uncharacterized protein n=1 Tax=Eumeta variegata TaxID=151549 RepID=A0A4C1SXC6_EUMVA|nr:hypothetical protein EVAR_5120_1 [Eumeta japonica]